MVSTIRSPLEVLESLTGGTPDVRAPLFAFEPLTGGVPDVNLPLIALESLTGGNPDVRAALIASEALTGGNPFVRCALIALEITQPLLEEGEMLTDLFPMLGMSWTTHKIATFATQVRTAPNLRSQRNSLTPQPAWDFEVSLDYLPSVAPFSPPALALAQADLQVIWGFFCDMRGRAKDWLFRDPQDFRCRGAVLGVGDGVTPAFSFARTFRTSPEPVGQVDMLEIFAFAPGDVDPATDTIAHAGHGFASGDGPVFAANTGGALPAGLTALTPYWVIADTANAVRLAVSKANALHVLPIAVDLTDAGTGAHEIDAGWAIYDDGALQLAGVTFFAPNQVVFDVAPAAGHAITADFDYFFVCHFLADAADAEQFNANLFQLMQLQFRADPP